MSNTIEFGQTDQCAIEQVRAAMPEETILYDLAELFKVFGDTTRVRILCALSQKELCVDHIAQLLEMGQSAISHQLRLLRGARLVRARRDGKHIYYSLDDSHVNEIFNCGLEHVTEK